MNLEIFEHELGAQLIIDYDNCGKVEFSILTSRFLGSITHNKYMHTYSVHGQKNTNDLKNMTHDFISFHA